MQNDRQKAQQELDDKFNKDLDSLSSFKEYRAVKVFPKAFYDSQTDINKFNNEVYVMNELKFDEEKNDYVDEKGHPNLVNFYHYFDEPKRYLIIQEICEGGDLHKLLEMQRPSSKCDESMSGFIIRQLLSGVKYLHEHGFCHRDLKLENVMISKTTGKFVDVRIIDFGETVDLRPSFNQKGTTRKRMPKPKDGFQVTSPPLKREGQTVLNWMKEFKGTVNYMSPEIINTELALNSNTIEFANEHLGYNQLCDIWAIGIIAYVLLVGEFPYDVQEESKLPAFERNKKIKEKLDQLELERQKFTEGGYTEENMPPWIKKIPADARSFVLRMFECNIGQRKEIRDENGKVFVQFFTNPDGGKFRPTADDLLEDPWLVDHLENQIENLLLGKIESESTD